MDANTPAPQAVSLNKPQDDPQANPADDAAGHPVRDSVSKSPAPEQPGGTSTPRPVSVPARPKGLNATAVVLGVVAVALSGLIIATEALDLNIDWSGKWPGAIVGIGVLFVALGAIGLVRRHGDA